MNIADKKYKKLILDIYNNGSWDNDKNVRAKYSDGVAAHCKSKFGYNIVFEEGEIPLITCKKMYPISALKEMYLFWIKQTVRKQDFKDINCNIWDEWMFTDGTYKDTLGKSYAYQFETEVNEIVIVSQRLSLSNGISKTDNILKNLITKDYDKEDIVFHFWQNLLKMCNKKATCSFLHKDWLNFKIFEKDIQNLPQYRLALRENFIGWKLDINYYKSNIYSKETCVWLRISESELYDSPISPIEVVFKDESKSLFLTLSDLSFKLGVSKACIREWIKNPKSITESQIKTIKRIKDNNIYRKALSKNQVEELINEIKNNPASKRLMTSFWNFKNVSQKALQECAFQTQWNVRGNKLDLILTQRSVDVGLGLPFNWFQYKMLQILIAHCTGYEAGTFIHHMGSLHYYDRHETALLELVNKPEYPLPSINLISKPDQDFFSYSYEDFLIENYKSGEHLALEVAI